MITTVEYAPGKHLDVHGDVSDPAVLIWHGRAPNERRALEPLAAALAARGACVYVPDWDSRAEDGGRADLLGSMRFARDESVSMPVLVGWSLGATAAASLALNARRLGLGMVPVVCLAGAFATTDPLSAGPFEAIAIPTNHQGRIHLVHGSLDGIAHIEGARNFADRLIEAGWATVLTEIAADHFGIVDGRDAVVDAIEDTFDNK